MRPFAALLAACALALAGCASVRVATDHDPKVDFGKLHSWSFAPHKTENPVVENTLVRNRIRDALERELTAKGFARTDSGPDFLVDFVTATERSYDVVSWPGWCHCWFGHRGFGPGWDWHDVDVVEYTQGMLVVGMIDPKSDDLLWRGTATQVVDEDMGSPEKIDAAVKALLERFPPGAKAK